MKEAILRRNMASFALQYSLFWRAIWAILENQGVFNGC